MVPFPLTSGLETGTWVGTVVTTVVGIVVGTVVSTFVTIVVGTVVDTGVGTVVAIVVGTVVGTGVGMVVAIVVGTISWPCSSGEMSNSEFIKDQKSSCPDSGVVVTSLLSGELTVSRAVGSGEGVGAGVTGIVDVMEGVTGIVVTGGEFVVGEPPLTGVEC